MREDWEVLVCACATRGSRTLCFEDMKRANVVQARRTRCPGFYGRDLACSSIPRLSHATAIGTDHLDETKVVFIQLHRQLLCTKAACFT
jgi:hypothetical protein